MLNVNKPHSFVDINNLTGDISASRLLGQKKGIKKMTLNDLLKIIQFGHEPEYGQIAFVHIVYFDDTKGVKIEFDFGTSENCEPEKTQALSILPEKLLNAKVSHIHTAGNGMLSIGCLVKKGEKNE